jgi:GAF domain-containing protein
MKTILVLAPTPVLSDAIRTLLSPEEYRLIHRTDLTDVEPLAKGTFLEACIVDAEEGDVRALWMIEKFHQLAPGTPILVFKGPTWEWEEEAYLKGVSAVLSKPVRGRLLVSMLSRFCKVTTPATPPARPLPARVPPAPPAAARPTYEITSGSQQALQVLRRFSEVLTHSLNTEAMLRQFLAFLREILGINRSVIFLRYAAGTFGIAHPDSRQLRSAAAIGLLPVALNTCELSLESGIGGFLYSTGRLLRRDSDEANAPNIQKEFQLLGAQLAVPILDRETLVGVAVFDERLTGEPLLNHELELIFFGAGDHPLEQAFDDEEVAQVLATLLQQPLAAVAFLHGQHGKQLRVRGTAQAGEQRMRLELQADGVAKRMGGERAFHAGNCRQGAIATALKNVIAQVRFRSRSANDESHA